MPDYFLPDCWLALHANELAARANQIRLMGRATERCGRRKDDFPVKRVTAHLSGNKEGILGTLGFPQRTGSAGTSLMFQFKRNFLVGNFMLIWS